MFKVVTIKLIAPNKDDILVKCKANIAKSTEGPECALIDERGGYTVHPVPAPDSIKTEPMIHTNAGGKHQKLMLFNLANAISTAPIIIGKKKLPKAPINTGITNKKIIAIACPVTRTL
ncbi:hypothetical protein CANMA_002357 [Candida margitis]|uniref:uncharacterized protein n=1 Tax=Candida margitis TaxID=1775924 RepID=UPI002226930F|nr:uncharacterized protein CANMA_002357 [Candida margitis]KAI5968504.1 hypothetical protein CANMA_002357 [Candida margitis]